MPDPVEEYLAAIEEPKQSKIREIRAAILANMDPVLEEGIQYKMLGYYVPHSVYPAGYHCDPKQPYPFFHVNANKGGISVYLFCIYGDEAMKQWMLDEHEKRGGKKIDMGAGCLRFKKPEEVPVELIAEVVKKVKVKDFLSRIEVLFEEQKEKRKAEKKANAKA